MFLTLAQVIMYTTFKINAEVQMERIRQLRNERGLSQAKLAVMADMDPATLNRLERGTGNPNLKTLERVADALGVEVADFFPKARRRSSPEPSLFTGVGDERLTHSQRSWRDFITRLANRVSSEADEKGYAPGWILEISEIPRDLTRVLFDNGVIGNRGTYSTETEWRQSWEIVDALDELNQAVEQAWRAQMRESEQLEQLREAATELPQLRDKRKADKSSKEARELEAIRDERRASA